MVGIAFSAYGPPMDAALRRSVPRLGREWRRASLLGSGSGKTSFCLLILVCPAVGRGLVPRRVVRGLWRLAVRASRESWLTGARNP